MLKVGLTGGIGSGKSLVADIFKHLGIPVYHADDRSKILLDLSSELRQQLINAFGSDIYNRNSINKPVFANLIFSSWKSIEKANSIIHPFVFTDFEQWCLVQKAAPYLMMEAAILFESGAQQILDHTITIQVDEDIRIQRVISKEPTDRDSVARRLQFQLTDDKRKALADSLIINNEKQLLIPQVIKIHELLVGVSGKNNTIHHG